MKWYTVQTGSQELLLTEETQRRCQAQRRVLPAPEAGRRVAPARSLPRPALVTSAGASWKTPTGLFTLVRIFQVFHRKLGIVNA